MHLTNKVEYFLATKELIHLSYTTYARALGFMKKNLGEPSHRFAYLCLDKVKIL